MEEASERGNTPSDRKTAGEYFGKQLTLLEMIVFNKPPQGEQKMNTIKDMLNEREQTHGNFAYTAMSSQDIKQALHGSINWESLTDIQKEALDNIASKMARIVAGNPCTVDHWKDIQGYAELAIRSMEGQKL